MGNWINNKGNIETQLEHMKSKASAIIREANVIAAGEEVGKMEIQVKLLLLKTTIIPSVFYNIEAWTNLRKGDEESMEVIQGKIIRKQLKIPTSTPYWGILSELGIWPIRWQITYKKSMLLQSIVTSDDQRAAKHIVMEQMRTDQKGCWYSEVKTSIEELGL